MSNKVILAILDGWGKAVNPEVSAIYKANTPFIDSLYTQYPNANLITFGEEVGLPEGQMGNSEVGHINIGAGRVVYQELARINKAIKDKQLEETEALKNLISYCKSNNKPAHLMSLLSDGGVHSHINHLIAISNILTNEGVTVYVHAFLDGRDTSPNGGAGYLDKFITSTDQKMCSVSTVIGRYYSMDRDNRWERIEKAYDLLVKGEGEYSPDGIEAIRRQYDNNITDEFIEGIRLLNGEEGLIHSGDAVFFTNFRTDRPRQLTQALTQKDFPEQEMTSLDLYYVTMTQYDETFQNIHVVFRKENLKNTLGEWLEKNGKTQLRIAETEKYPHVTFFFSGGREEPFEGEKRIVVNSPKVATYDLKPEMSAFEVTDNVVQAIEDDYPDCVILNYANADMVGHTGDFEAAKKAAETIDECMKTLVQKAKEKKYNVLVIADHGNSDIMINPDGSPHTAHTTNLVPIILITESSFKVKDGKLADVAPTMLTLLQIDKPAEMDGESVLVI